jgi:dethiobiotin synthetase
MKIFVTGISTDVGKTVASAIITEALQADYWKPVQSGDLDKTDAMKVQGLISNSKTCFHPEAYRLNFPASPHYSAAMEGLVLDLDQIKEPKTKNHLVIEGAGGVLVPINEKDSVIDLIQKDYKVVIVSRHYLGSINHTLLTVECLRARGANIAGIIFSGDEHASTESIILSRTGLPMLGRINQEPYFDQNVIADYADEFLPNLLKL